MKKYRIDAKTDKNQNQIVGELRHLGFDVEINHDDILIGKYGLTGWYEIKNPDKISKKTGKIRESAIKPDQKRLRAEWKGHYKIVSSLEEILEDFKLLISRRMF